MYFVSNCTSEMFAKVIKTSLYHKKVSEQLGVHQRISSVAYPHFNFLVEIGVKTSKSIIITENTDVNRNLNIDAFQKVMLSYRNTSSADGKLLPAECVFGRPTRKLFQHTGISTDHNKFRFLTRGRG